jgi:hypothetical protein
MLRIGEPLVHPDKSRKPFFDGMESESGPFSFVCRSCHKSQDLEVWSFLDDSNKWQKSLRDAERALIEKSLRLPMNSGFWKSHEGGQPYFAEHCCPQCGARYLVYVGFYERQPMRYFGTLQGVYDLST